MAHIISAVDCRPLVDTFKSHYHLDFQLECYSFETESNDNIVEYQRDFLDQIAAKNENNAYSSRAHTSKLPGENYVAYAQSNETPIGVDIESRKRDCSEACKRISSEDEFLAAPSSLMLWTAKEASFKCLRSHSVKPQVVSQIQTFDWQKQSPNTFSFQAKFSEDPGILIRGTSSLSQLFTLSVASFEELSQFNT